MLLLIDFREKNLVKRIKSLTSSPIDKDNPVPVQLDNLNIEVQVVNLPVGDLIIKNNENPSLGFDNLEYVIERKTYQDLCSSIVDGRFRQQKERIMEGVQDAQKVVFLIEGIKRISRISYGSMQDNMVCGAIHNMIFKHNFKVITTESEEDTWNNIKHLCKKVSSKSFEQSTIKPIAPIKLQKRSDKVIENVFPMQLSVIPGVSFSTAMIIAKKYNTMQSLMEAYSSCNDEESKKSLLADIQINVKRRLGPALSKSIYSALHG